MKAIRRIRKFFQIPGRERALMLEALYWLMIYTFLIYIIPFRWWQDRIGRKMQPWQEEYVSKGQMQKIGLIRRSVFRAKKALLGFPKCFALSLTLKKMLQKRGIDSTLYLGVKKNGNESLIAHAWLKSGDITVYGGRKANLHYKELVIYT
jgi:hypothetical protein